MGSLFLVELASFLSKTTQSTIVVDFNRDQQVKECLPACRVLLTMSMLCGGRGA